VGDNELTDTSIFPNIKIAKPTPQHRNINIKIATSTSQHQLYWILTRTTNMPAHEINLDPFKDDIVSWFNDDMSHQEIAERLANDHNIVCTDRTIRQRLKIWGLKKQT
jgi:hypothetical protein